MGNFGAIVGLANAILFISVGATGLAAYTFFIILPPALQNVDNAGRELINYNPGTEQEFYSGASQLRTAGTNLQNTARGIPCSGQGGCLLGAINFSNQRSQLISMGSSLQKMADNIRNIGDDFRDTVPVINSVGYGALGIKDGLYYGVMTLLALGISGILTGTALMVVARVIKGIEKVNYGRT